MPTRRFDSTLKRLSIVSEAMSRSRGPSGQRPVHDAFLALRKSLDEVDSIDRAALCQLESSLSEGELAKLVESLAAASALRYVTFERYLA